MNEIRPRLENWAFVVRPVVPRQHCYSAEGQYAMLRPFLVMGDMEEDRRAPRRDVDHHDAWRIEVACRQLPLKQHALIAAAYVYRAPPWRICRALHIPAGWRFRRLWDAIEQAELTLAFLCGRTESDAGRLTTLPAMWQSPLRPVCAHQGRQA